MVWIAVSKRTSVSYLIFLFSVTITSPFPFLNSYYIPFANRYRFSYPFHKPILYLLESVPETRYYGKELIPRHSYYYS